MKWILILIPVLITLAACSTISPTSQPALSAVSPASQTGATNHAPMILGVVERTETKQGLLLVSEDITFTDTEGDATTVVDKLVSSNKPWSVSNVEIMVSPDEQKSGAKVTDAWGCQPNAWLVVETRILDKAGSLSEPVNITVSCPKVQLNTGPFLVTGLIIGLILGLGLLVGAWLLFRHRPLERLPALQSTLLLFCLLFPLFFMYLLFHEGGHALMDLAHGENVTAFYIHPFSFSGYVRPVFDWNNVWFHAAGAALVVPASLIISILFWKRRSVSSLPLVLFFPWAAIMQSLNILMVGGDFRNIVQITGLPAIVFNVIGALLMGIGIFCFVTLLPLLGLTLQDRKSLFVLPASIFLWSVVGTAAAYLFVPGSLIDVHYDLLGEILNSANSFLIGGVIAGVLFAMVYLTLYRRLYPRLPAGLRTETVTLTWRDLRIPALLSVISVILGIIMII